VTDAPETTVYDPADMSTSDSAAELPSWIRMLAARGVDATLLPSALSAVLGGCEVSWARDRDSTDGPTGEATMRLRHPEGGTLVVSRPGRSFSPAERAQGVAVVQLTGSAVAATVWANP